MLRFLLGLFSNDLLIELRENLITVQTFHGDKKLELVPIVAIDSSSGKQVVKEIGANASNVVGADIKIFKPFSHPRSLVSNFKYSEKVIQHAIRKIHDGTYFSPAPRVVMHQLEKDEGGLTDVENRVLLELGYGGGAREVLVYSGPPINVKIDSYESVRIRIDT